ncbi:hypothetical protein BH11PAT4_BH11PAT4_5640 [soil metagenome]
MAFVHLDQAARQVGKSEVTVRRLVKAGKISHQKEKTLTGFIYLVDPTEISHYYGDRGSSSEDFAQQMRESGAEVVEEVRIHRPDTDENSKEQPQAEQQASTRQIRVAVASETGNLSEYWQKRAETYENRYHQTLESQSKLREELGVWRGRAEQAQNMLVKLLPAPAPVVPEEKVEVPAPVAEVKKVERKEAGGNWVVGLLAVIAGLFVVALGVGLYIFSTISR